MFSRNRFNGQHGTGVAPKGGTKTKIHPPKKRAPNPRVALVIWGKIHRLLQGSADHHVQDPHLDYAGIEEDQEGETQEEEKELRGIYAKVAPRAEGCSTRVPNSKGHGGVLGAPCVGEVELNREGCVRIPCTLQHNSRSPGNQKQTSPEVNRNMPEQKQAALHYSQVGPDMNGTKFAGAVGGIHSIIRPSVRPKRPYSTGDCMDYNFNRALPGTLLEEDEEGLDKDEEEESSAIIEHILKELRGINKIQEEISDLRDYLTSVRGSVEEVSSCVDAVLLEIEGIRSGNKASAGVHAGTWSGAVGGRDRASPHRRPASAYGSLGRTMPPSDSSVCQPVYNERHSIHGEFLLPRAEGSALSQSAESVDPEQEEPDDTSDHSSDIPVGAVARKLSFGYIERQDGQDCPSTSSLSSGHSSKSESDLERPSFSHGRRHRRVDGGEEHWDSAGLPHSAAVESVWHGEDAYSRQGSLEEHEGGGAPCCEESQSWDHYRGRGGYGTMGQCSTGSSENLSVHSGRHYNSPASTSSRDDWQSQRLMPQPQSGTQLLSDTHLESPSIGYECAADCSYPQSSGYHSVDGHAEEVEYHYPPSTDAGYTAACQVDTDQDSYSVYEESADVTWTEASLCTTLAEPDAPFTQDVEAGTQRPNNSLPHSDSSDVQNVGFNVKRIGRAVLDFSSALRGALRKIEVTGAQNPGEEAEFDISMHSELPAPELPTGPSCVGPIFDQAFEETPQDAVDADSRDVIEELNQNNVPGKSNPCPVEALLKEANNSLPPESADSCQPRLCSVELPTCPDELPICPDPNSSNTATSLSPEGLTERPAEGPVDLPIAAQLSQCTTAESLSLSLSAEEPAAQQEGPGESQALQPQQQDTDSTAAPEAEVEGDMAEFHPEMSERDARRLKCQRSFQQILREKRETRHNLASITMSAFPQEDLDPGSLYLCGSTLYCITAHWIHWILSWNELWSQLLHFAVLFCLSVIVSLFICFMSERYRRSAPISLLLCM